MDLPQKIFIAIFLFLLLQGVLAGIIRIFSKKKSFRAKIKEFEEKIKVDEKEFEEELQKINTQSPEENVKEIFEQINTMLNVSVQKDLGNSIISFYALDITRVKIKNTALFLIVANLFFILISIGFALMIYKDAYLSSTILFNVSLLALILFLYVFMLFIRYAIRIRKEASKINLN